MNSSTSTSKPPTQPRASWRRFFWALLGWTLVLGGTVYLFIAIVDPWDILPLSPPFNRGPVSTNARWSFPALARSPRFDSMILGSSGTRLFQPAILDPLFGAHFVNLSMNNATAYEQWRIGKLFLLHHPQTKYIMIGLDSHWCYDAGYYQKYTRRPFPEWMYGENLWKGYAEIFNLYAVEQAGIQFSILTGMKPQRYGRDGYTNFLPAESDYDLAKVRAGFPKDNARYWMAPQGEGDIADDDFPLDIATSVPVELPQSLSAAQLAALDFPEQALLADLLAASPDTEKILFFIPFHVSGQPLPGSAADAYVKECKARISAIAAGAPNTRLIDYMIPSGITRDDSNYWDFQHFRASVALWVMRDLRAAMDKKPGPEENGVILR
jgi:hypothetical protein